MKNQGFTLIELLTVVVIMVVLFSIVAFGASGARSSARDERRKADMALISSGLEKYRSDCGVYPPEDDFEAVAAGSNLTGNGSTPSCLSANVYIREMPDDPESTKDYSYNLNASSTSYTLCASLEAAPIPPFSTADLASCTASCGSGGVSCNYLIRNP